MIRWCLLIWVLVLFVEVWTANKPRVFGGTSINYDTHKYLVIILNDFRSLCSGSILNRMTILTAAHCFNTFSCKFLIMHNGNGESSKIAEVTYDGVIKHPEYNKKISNREVDLAIMKTEEGMQFDECIRPIGLLRRRSVQISDQAIVAGFGRADPTGMPSGREGKVTVTNCPGKIHDVICTLGYVRAASGDSGGALIFRNRLAGVTSGSCTNAENLELNQPCLTVFTNVTANIDWITSNLEDPITTEIPTTTLATIDTLSLADESFRQSLYRSKQHKTMSTAIPTIYRNNLENIYMYLPSLYHDDIFRTKFNYIFYEEAVLFKKNIYQMTFSREDNELTI